MTESPVEPTARAHILVSGRVQGVGYRAFAARTAARRGLAGGVRNLDDGRVELEVEGQKAVIEALLQELKVGPPAAYVTKIETEWGAATGRFADFSIWY
jgi:acylphosphatase